MTAAGLQADGSELRLKFADGSSVPFAVRELIATIRNRKVLALTCLLATLLAIPGGGAFSDAVPLWARIALNLFAVALFAVLFPALLQEADFWARKRKLRTVYEPFVTVPTALVTTLAIEALTVFVVGSSDLTRWDLAIKLGFGAVFWELHITLMLLFMGPTLKEQDQAKRAASSAIEPRDAQVRIGNTLFDPTEILSIRTDDHFLIIQTPERTARILASLNDVHPRLSGFGTLVHRCHWVAFDQLGEIRRNGRSFQMQTRSGHQVPVARDRRKEIESIAARKTSQ
jgi:hypothetical protein